MGSASRRERHAPLRLGAKLLQIREALGVSQEDLLNLLGLPEALLQTSISRYERGTREPPLLILLRYARLANVEVEALLDDELDLPQTLPGPAKSPGVKRAAA